jgi:CRP-like cAMP-binding protein
MENMTPEAIYSQLREALCKDKPIPDADWDAFIEKTKIDQFEENQVVVEQGQLSTHSYFIIQGLIMCYIPRKPKSTIMWFRAENEYAFTVDKLNFGKPPRNNEERLMALEDSIVVSISHEDLEILQSNNRRIRDMVHDSFMRALFALDGLSRRSTKDPEYNYDLVQQYTSFNLSRVPAIYLALYLGTNVKRLAEIRKTIQQ